MPLYRYKALNAHGEMLEGQMEAGAVPNAALAQSLLETTWERTLADGETRRPWPWADTHAVAKLTSPRLGVSQVVLAGTSLICFSSCSIACVVVPRLF